MTGMDSPTESESDRDGFLSYAAEWHSFSHGVYNGMKSWRARPKTVPDDPDIEKEPHYYKGGYVLGTVLQAVIALSLAAIQQGAIL